MLGLGVTTGDAAGHLANTSIPAWRSMNFEQVHDLVWTAVEGLVAEDAEILPGTERTVVARLAVHLDRGLQAGPNPDAFVADVEYERAGNDPKRLVGQNEATRKIVPDILVHRRGLYHDRENLLVVEVKPARYSDPASVQADHAKVALMTQVDPVIHSHARGLGRAGVEGMGEVLDTYMLPPGIHPYAYGLWIKFRPAGIDRAHWFVRQGGVTEWVETARDISEAARPDWA